MMQNNPSRFDINQDPANLHNPMRREKRNVYINGKRTSLSIESYIWAEIDQLSADENISVDELCSKIDEYRDKRFSLPAVIRYLSVQVKAHQHRDHVLNGELAETKLTFPSPFYLALEKIRNLSPDPDLNQDL